MHVNIGATERQEIANLLARRFPKRSQIRITDLAEISHGWETDVFAINSQFNVDGENHREDFILRAFQGMDAAFRTKREAEVVMKARELDIPVPRIEFYITENSPIRSPFILMEKVDGRLFNDALADASSERFVHLTDQMASVLVRIHKLPVAEFSGPLTKNAGDIENYLPRQISQLQSTITKHGLRGFNPLIHRLREESPEVRFQGESLLHNDYHPQNIFLREDDDLAVFDWSFADLGDHRLDLAWTVLLFGLMTEFRHRELLLQAYEAHAGLAVKDFEFFEVLKFTARMVTLVSWLTGSVPIPVAKITPEAMRGAYKVHITNVYERLNELTSVHIPDVESLLER
jgi:aminoglycoside phosphotransferase (APT) family kinase protein